MDEELLALRTARRLLAAKLVQERTTVLRQAQQIEAMKAHADSTRVPHAGELNNGQGEADLLRTQLEVTRKELKELQSRQNGAENRGGANASDLADAASEIDRLKAELQRAQNSTNKEDAALAIAQLQAEIDEKDSLILEQDAIIEEERKLVRQITAERDECDRLIAEKEQQLQALRSGGGTAPPEVQAELDTLKAQFAQEMEKKKQFSVVFLKLKAEFDEQKKKLAQQAELLQKLGHGQ